MAPTIKKKPVVKKTITKKSTVKKSKTYNGLFADDNLGPKSFTLKPTPEAFKKNFNF